MHRFVSFLSRRARAVIIGACAAAAVAVGITLAVLSGSPGAPATAAPTTTSPPTTAVAPARTHAKVPKVRGTITAIAATQWTVTTPKGVAFTVTISPTTKYGTTKAPATAANFATGQTVVVAGSRQGTTITATRIAVPQPKATPAAPAGTPTTAAA